MSMSWENGNVSPAHYPNPDQKRKTSSAKGSDPARKKKKEKKEAETPVIQNMTPVGLDAFKKNEMTCLGQMPEDNDPAVVVVEMMKKEPDYLRSPNNPHCHGLWRWHEGVSYPQPTFKEENEAMQQLMNELTARCLVL